jgi:hypothetical protein
MRVISILPREMLHQCAHQDAGTSASAAVYTKRSKVHGSVMSGKKVTLAVICRMIAAISLLISFSDFCTLLQVYHC